MTKLGPEQFWRGRGAGAGGGGITNLLTVYGCSWLSTVGGLPLAGMARYHVAALP